MFELLTNCSEKSSIFKCGEVYCEVPNSYNVNCSACDTKFPFEEFPKHFQDLHLSSQEPKKTNSQAVINQVIGDVDEVTRVDEMDITWDLNEREDSSDEEDQQEMAIEFMEVRLPKLKNNKAVNFLPEHVMDFEFNTVETKKELKSINPTEKFAGKAQVGVQEAKNSTLFQEDSIGGKDKRSETISRLNECNNFFTMPKNIDAPKLEKPQVGESNKKLGDKCQLSSIQGNKCLSDCCINAKVGVKSENNNTKDKCQETFTCKYCQRFFTLKRSLKYHVRVVHKKVPLETASKKTDSQHKQLADKSGPSVCNICGKTFSNFGNMNTHKKRHTGVKSHKCPECDNFFYTEHEMKKHLIRHTDLLAEICEICGHGFRNAGKLKGHMRRHTGERPAKCDVCGKSFYSKHDLNVHHVTHTTERPFSCDVCSSTFRTKKALRVHKKLHVAERPHQCELCDKGFLRLSGLDSHMRQVHKKGFI